MPDDIVLYFDGQEYLRICADDDQELLDDLAAELRLIGCVDIVREAHIESKWQEVLANEQTNRRTN